MIRLLLHSYKLAGRHIRLILLLWLINLVLSLIFTSEYMGIFKEFFSDRLISPFMVRENIYTFFMEFRYWMRNSLSGSFTLMRIGGILHFFVTLALSGGIIIALIKQKFPGMKNFLESSYFYLWSMVKVSLISPIVLGACLFLALLLGLPFTFLLPDVFVESTYFYFFIAWLTLGICFVILGILFLDLVKVQLVRFNISSILKALKISIQSISMKIAGVAGLFLLLYLLLFCITLLYWWLPSFAGRLTWHGNLLDFLILQVIIYLLIWFRLTRYAIIIGYLEQYEDGVLDDLSDQ